MCRVTRQSLTVLAIASLLAGAVCGAWGDDPPGETGESLVADPRIEALLGPIREKHELPGLVAGIVRGKGLRAVAAVGVRKLGSPEPITIHDQVHIGSCTKAMTATQLAMLVEQGRLAWTATLAEVFADLKEDLHADFRAVTVLQLLTHRAGLPANVAVGAGGTGPLIDQRQALARSVLSRPPVHPPDTKFLYSNVGYTLAGHVAERVTGQPWEDLVREGLFVPLTMKSAGFGPPGTKDQVDQPWGHRALFGKLLPSQADNSPLIGPAGTIHCTLADWGKFAGLHLHGARGERTLLRPETVAFLHTPPEGEERYACGWGAVDREWAHGRALTHSGSNTMWFATVWIAPARNAALLAVTNSGGPTAPRACDEAIAGLIGLIDETPERQDSPR